MPELAVSQQKALKSDILIKNLAKFATVSRDFVENQNNSQFTEYQRNFDILTLDLIIYSRVRAHGKVPSKSVIPSKMTSKGRRTF